MGMENDNHEVLTWVEMQENARKEKEEAERKAKENDRCLRALCSFVNRKNEMKLLLIDKDRQFFTLNFVRYEQFDPRNNSPEIPIWTKEPIPISDNDLRDFFG